MCLNVLSIKETREDEVVREVEQKMLKVEESVQWSTDRDRYLWQYISLKQGIWTCIPNATG